MRELAPRHHRLLTQRRFRHQVLEQLQLAGVGVAHQGVRADPVLGFVLKLAAIELQADGDRLAELQTVRLQAIARACAAQVQVLELLRLLVERNGGDADIDIVVFERGERDLQRQLAVVAGDNFDRRDVAAVTTPTAGGQDERGGEGEQEHEATDAHETTSYYSHRPH